MFIIIIIVFVLYGSLLKIVSFQFGLDLVDEKISYNRLFLTSTYAYIASKCMLLSFGFTL